MNTSGGEHLYPLLIVREEIVCLILLIFLGINARYYKMGKDNGQLSENAGLCHWACCI